jgi:hypothetical protein
MLIDYTHIGSYTLKITAQNFGFRIKAFGEEASIAGLIFLLSINVP